ncbi:hypothetical protein GVAV_000712 [Gurleya vavrai]
MNIHQKYKAIKPEVPNQLWVCDLIGRLKGSDGSNKYIFVAVDHSTKWAETCVITNKSGETITKIIKKKSLKNMEHPRNYFLTTGLNLPTKTFINCAMTME